jgi:hypothetical protein
MSDTIVVLIESLAMITVITAAFVVYAVAKGRQENRNPLEEIVDETPKDIAV